jgi:hypothetical protein
MEKLLGELVRVNASRSRWIRCDGYSPPYGLYAILSLGRRDLNSADVRQQFEFFPGEKKASKEGLCSCSYLRREEGVSSKK